MKQFWVRSTFIAFVACLFAPLVSRAQKDEKADKEKKEVQQIIITRKSDKDGKTVIEVNGDKITVNGKPLEEFKDKDGNVTVRVNKWKDPESLNFQRIPGAITWKEGKDGYTFFTGDENRAMLGVSTQKTDAGVEVQSVSKESAAEKAGLKEKDIITKIDGKKMEDPDDLSEAVRNHKPGDKIEITFLRDKKEQKATAELGKWKGVGAWNLDNPDHDFKMDLGNLDLEKVMPHMKAPNNQFFTWSGGNPKLGLSIQDSDDGKGVKVTDVDEESNAAKAGLKEGDIITEADGKAINNTDDMVKVIRDSKDKVSIMVKLQREGKIQNVEVRMPRRLKSANL